MSPEEFRAALHKLGWKQADFAREAGIDADTVSRWMKKGSTAPWVRSWLEPRLFIVDLSRWTKST